MRRVGRSLLLLSCGLSAPRSVGAWAASTPRAALPLLRPLTVRCSRAETSLIACVDTTGSATPQPILSINPQLDASLPYRNLAFYVISPVADSDAAVEEHRAFLGERGMVGRVYICADGINAQVSGTTKQCEEYRGYCHATLGAGASSPILFKEDPVPELSYPRLRVKHRRLVSQTADEGGRDLRVDLADRGVDLTPEEWERMLASPETPIVLDVRNDYEWDVGRFDRAERPSPSTFSESDENAYGLPADPETREQTPVMMYCTGGIRCEYFSARLKANGFKKVYKLQGGIQHYGNAYAKEQRAPPHWQGSLFVFDRRNTVPLGGAESNVVGKCLHCGSPTETFVNCGNIDCNKLHLVCKACLPVTGGFCCEPCSSAPRRRPLADPALTQGAPPGGADPNRLSSIKPRNIGRKEFDVDAHGYREGAQ